VALSIRTGQKINDVGLDARTRLREAALDRFGRQGVHATSTREVVAAAGQRNPSAITYYFGSKAELVADLLREVNREQSAIVQRQVALAAQLSPPTPAQWVAAAVDAANGMLDTERGCLLVRVWAESDAADPDSVERFLASDHPLAVAWRRAATATFPELPPLAVIARNVIVLRTLQWITVRRAGRILSGARPEWPTDPTRTRSFLMELGLNILTPETTVTEAELRGI
jgi:AcrR family transcriptional regulator